jgi:NADH:ubiquinone oxidoreductase subunit D
MLTELTRLNSHLLWLETPDIDTAFRGAACPFGKPV